MKIFACWLFIVGLLIPVFVFASHGLTADDLCSQNFELLGRFTPRFFDVFTRRGPYREVLAQLVAGSGGDPRQSVFLTSNFPEAFSGGAFDVERATAALKKLATSGRPFFETASPDILESPAFIGQFRSEYGMTPSQLVDKIRRAHPDFSFESTANVMGLSGNYFRFETKSPISADVTKILDLEKSFTKDFTPDEKIALTTLLAASAKYSKKSRADYRLTHVWDSAVGSRMAESADPLLLKVGDRVLFSGDPAYATIQEFLGTGSEHTVYRVRDEHGVTRVLKIGGFYPGKVDQRNRIEQGGLPVLGLTQVAKEYYFVEPFNETAQTAFAHYLDNKGKIQPPPILDFYRKYLRSNLVITDLHFDNLGMTSAGELKISDWVETGLNVPGGPLGAPGFRSLELSAEIAKSFDAIWKKKVASFGGQLPNPVWSENFRNELKTLIRELNLDNSGVERELRATQYRNQITETASELLTRISRESNAP